MRHKTVQFLATITSLLLMMNALGQGESGTALGNPELAQARALLQAGREQIIREELRLTEEEAEGFWPVYAEYIAELAVVRDRKAKLVAGFMQAYRDGTFSDEYAEWLIDENFAIRSEWMRVQQQFLPRFRYVLPVVKVARFYQLENKMDAEVDAQLALVVPLVE